LNGGLGNERMKMNTIPVDEMLSELRMILEQFDREPTFANFDRMQKETRRIEGCCEDILYPDNDAPNVKLTGGLTAESEKTNE